MFDLTQMGLPVIVEIDGARWLLIHRVNVESDTHEHFIACALPSDFPAPCSFVRVPQNPKIVKMMAEAWAVRDAKAAAKAAKEDKEPT